MDACMHMCVRRPVHVHSKMCTKYQWSTFPDTKQATCYTKSPTAYTPSHTTYHCWSVVCVGTLGRTTGPCPGTAPSFPGWGGGWWSQCGGHPTHGRTLHTQRDRHDPRELHHSLTFTPHRLLPSSLIAHCYIMCLKAERRLGMGATPPYLLETAARSALGERASL